MKNKRLMLPAALGMGNVFLYVAVHTVLATSPKDCSGVTNTNTSGNPCVKVEYYLGTSPWNVWCTQGALGVCQDGNIPSFDTTTMTYTPCTSQVGVMGNGGRPKNKTCN